MHFHRLHSGGRQGRHCQLRLHVAQGILNRRPDQLQLCANFKRSGGFTRSASLPNNLPRA